MSFSEKYICECVALGCDGNLRQNSWATGSPKYCGHHEPHQKVHFHSDIYCTHEKRRISCDRGSEFLNSGNGRKCVVYMDAVLPEELFEI